MKVCAGVSRKTENPLYIIENEKIMQGRGYHGQGTDKSGCIRLLEK